LSYSLKYVEEVSLEQFVFERTAQYGYVRDILLPQEGYDYLKYLQIPDEVKNALLPECEKTRDAMVNNDPNALLDRFIFHGSPAPSDVIPIH
jgi:hypothetical protein